MIIIGINGHVGAGKTTTSNILLKEEKTRVIHLDKLFDETKKKYFKEEINVLKQNDGTELIFLDENCKIKQLFRNRYLKYLCEYFKIIYANVIINEAIKNSIANGLDYLIIEGRNLDIYKLDRYCDIKIFVNSSMNVRFARAQTRDLQKTDIDFFNKEMCCDINFDEYYFIPNNSSLDNLKEQLKTIEFEIKGKSLHK